MQQILINLFVIFSGVFIVTMHNVYIVKSENAYLFDKQLPAKYTRLRHVFGGLLHVWIGFVIGALFGWRWGFFMGSLTWFFTDGFINSFALHTHWFSIGTTAAIDKLQQWVARKIRWPVEVFSGILKCLVLTIAIILLIQNLIK